MDANMDGGREEQTDAGRQTRQNCREEEDSPVDMRGRN